MAVLVAGVGYIGAALAASLLRAGERVVALDNGFSTDLDAIRRLADYGDFQLVKGSVTSKRSVRQAFARGPFSVVYHLAAQASAYVPPELERYTEVTNLCGPRLVFDAAVRQGVPRIVYASSFRVYGPVLPVPLDESAPYGPQRDLAHLSHVYSEKLLEMYADRGGCIGVAVRLAVVYGIGPIMKSDYRYLTVPNKFCLQVVRGETLEVYPLATTPTAFVHLDDGCAALRVAAVAPWAPGFHAANASGEVWAVPQVAAVVVHAASTRGIKAEVRCRDSGLLSASPTGWWAGEGPPAAIILDHFEESEESSEAGVATDAFRPRCLDVPIRSRLQAAGWRPMRTLADSVGEILDYFRAREAA